MFSCLKDKLLVLVAVVIVGLGIAVITCIYIYNVPVPKSAYHHSFLGVLFEAWVLLILMLYFIVSAIIIAFYLYYRHTEKRIKELENKFSNYLKDLDELNEEWADENHELWKFIESILKEKDIKKIKRKAESLLNSRTKSK